MSDFFEDLGKKLSETAEAVGRKTEEVIEIQKLRSQIRSLERSNERDYTDIGKMVFEQFKNHVVIAPEYTDLCEDIVIREATLEECVSKIAEFKGSYLCENCKSELEEDMVFCPKCGHKAERTTQEEECVDSTCEEGCDCGCNCEDGEACNCEEGETCCCEKEKDGE